MAKCNESTVLFCKSPASFCGGNVWLDASFTGNGKVGAAVLGAYSNERILINHVGLRWRGYTGVLQDVSDVFPKVRKAYSDGKIFDAEQILSNELVKRNYKPELDAPLPLAVLAIDFVNDGFVTEYARMTDMKSGEVNVNFRMGSTHISRGVTVTRGSDIIAFNAAKNGPDKFNAVIRLELPKGVQAQNSVIKYDGGYIYFGARGASGLDYGLVARVVMASGSGEMLPDGIAVKASDGFTLFAKTFVGSSYDTEFKSIKNELAAIKGTYNSIQNSSENAHRKLFDATRFELDAQGRNVEMQTLVSATSNAALEPNLIERLWNYGKYLAICGGVALSPAGLWSGDAQTTHGHLNLNVGAHLALGGIVRSVAIEKVAEYIALFEKYADDLKKNAARVYGNRGFFVPSVTSPQSLLFGSTDAGVVNFIASSAISANILYSYFLTTADLKTLRGKIMPYMKEIFNFYSDFLKLDNSGAYSTIPSYSPNSTPGNTIQGKPLRNFKFATNSAIDFLAFDNLLDNLIDGAKAMGATDEVAVWEDMKTKIPVYGVNDAGCLKEYVNSAFIDGTVNVGCLHNYGLYPLKNFSFKDQVVQYRAAVSGAAPSTITLKKASANSIIARLSRSGGLQNSAVLAMCAAQLAHAGEAVAVRNLLMRLVASSFTPSGTALTNDWRGSGWTRQGSPDLDINANLGFATAVTECIVQSSPKVLKLLPAVFAEISAGKIFDVATDFAARVSVEWDIKKGKCQVKIMPKVARKIDVTLPYKLKGYKGANYNSETRTIEGLALQAGKLVVLELAF
jgi:alpha-L-fucosidase 2